MESASSRPDLLQERRRDVAVIIITRNRIHELLRTLYKMTTLPEKPQIVVVDNNSSDNTAVSVRKSFPSVEVITLHENIGTAARTVGVQHVNAEYIAFCDDDCWWAPGSLEQAATLFYEHAELALINARVLIGQQQREDPVCGEMEQSALKSRNGMPGSPILGFLAGASVVRRSAFLAMGGFPSKFMVGGEEELLAIDFAMAGWHLAYVKQLTVHHFPSLKREVSLRRKTEVRNKLWVTWLRRPFPHALRHTSKVLFSGFSERFVWAGFFSALKDLPWVLANRKVVPRHLHRELKKLECKKCLSNAGDIL